MITNILIAIRIVTFIVAFITRLAITLIVDACRVTIVFLQGLFTID